MSLPTSLQRVRYSREVFAVLDAWGLSSDEQAVLLGFEPVSERRRLAKMRRGGGLPDAPAIDQRCDYLLRIAAATRAMYPQNVASANTWPTTSNPYFQDRSPVQVMLNQGITGMQRVIEHLDGDIIW